jgi:hypothetical protein
MRITLKIVGVLATVIGVVWFFQGLGVLPGSFMTGQVEWAVYGAATVTVGIALLFWASRKRR